MENIKKPLAVINTKPIYESDIDEMIESLGQRGAAYRSEQGRAIILEQLIAQRLFLADAMRNLYEREPEFKAQLARVKEQMLVQYAINKAVGSVKVTDAEAKKFFDENPEQFEGQPTVSASHILVETEEQAVSVLTAIQNGEISFEDAAKAYSSCPSSAQGGSLGEFGRGQMVAEFDTACFEMEVGEVRGPVKTQFGYHLIRLDGKNEGEAVDFETIREQLKEHLLSEKQQKAYQSRVNQLKILYPVER